MAPEDLWVMPPEYAKICGDDIEMKLYYWIAHPPLHHRFPPDVAAEDWRRALEGVPSISFPLVIQINTIRG